MKLFFEWVIVVGIFESVVDSIFGVVLFVVFGFFLVGFCTIIFNRAVQN